MEHFNSNNNNNNTATTINNNHNNDSNINNNSETTGGAGVEEITTGLDRMNVDMIDIEILDHCQTNTSPHDHIFSNQQAIPFQSHTPEDRNSFNDEEYDNHGYNYYDDSSMSVDGSDSSNPIILTRSEHYQLRQHRLMQQQQQQQHQQEQQQQQNMSNILIVTNVDSSVFSDDLTKSKFESLFTNYDPNVTFRYLKSFRRVRLDFANHQTAEIARSNLSEYRLGNTEFKCYSAQFIKPNNNGGSQDIGVNSTHLNIPKLTKQFLISPPASPPVGWQPVTENSPCIDVQLISAIANLVPGKVHEIHAGNESQPGIFVEVCEDVQFESSVAKTCSRIPKTMSPAGLTQQDMNHTSVSMNHCSN